MLRCPLQKRLPNWTMTNRCVSAQFGSSRNTVWLLCFKPLSHALPLSPLGGKTKTGEHPQVTQVNKVGAFKTGCWSQTELWAEGNEATSLGFQHEVQQAYKESAAGKLGLKKKKRKENRNLYFFSAPTRKIFSARLAKACLNLFAETSNILARSRAGSGERRQLLYLLLENRALSLQDTMFALIRRKPRAVQPVLYFMVTPSDPYSQSSTSSCSLMKH